RVFGESPVGHFSEIIEVQATEPPPTRDIIRYSVQLVRFEFSFQELHHRRITKHVIFGPITHRVLHPAWPAMSPLPLKSSLSEARANRRAPAHAGPSPAHAQAACQHLSPIHPQDVAASAPRDRADRLASASASAAVR